MRHSQQDLWSICSKQRDGDSLRLIPTDAVRHKKKTRCTPIHSCGLRLSYTYCLLTSIALVLVTRPRTHPFLHASWDAHSMAGMPQDPCAAPSTGSSRHLASHQAWDSKRSLQPFSPGSEGSPQSNHRDLWDTGSSTSAHLRGCYSN